MLYSLPLLFRAFLMALFRCHNLGKCINCTKKFFFSTFNTAEWSCLPYFIQELNDLLILEGAFTHVFCCLRNSFLSMKIHSVKSFSELIIFPSKISNPSPISCLKSTYCWSKSLLEDLVRSKTNW